MSKIRLELTEQQHQDILNYLKYLQELMFLQDWDVILSPVVYDDDDRSFARIYTCSKIKRGEVQISKTFFTKHTGEQEFPHDRTMHLIHEMCHLLLKNIEWMSSTGNYSYFLPKSVTDIQDENILCEVEKTVDHLARIFHRFVKPFSFTLKEQEAQPKPFEQVVN